MELTVSGCRPAPGAVPGLGLLRDCSTSQTASSFLWAGTRSGWRGRLWTGGSAERGLRCSGRRKFAVLAAGGGTEQEQEQEQGEQARPRQSSNVGSAGPRRPSPLSLEDKERRTRMEDELKDSRNFIDFLAPRPLRRILFAFGGASCVVGFFISVSQLLANPSFEAANGGSSNVAINLLGAIGFGSLYVWEGIQAEAQKTRRKKVREAQIRRGDREVYTNESGETMSRLKPVDDEWIIRRLDRWGAQDGLPQVGPKKGALLQDLIRQRAPKTIVEVGTFTGYSAIKMAQASLPSSKIISFEKDLKWVAVAKRFISQAKLSKKVDVRWGDAVQQLQKFDGKIDFLFLDAVPSEYIDYLKAAEPHLSEGALIVADNAGLYSSQMQPYLDYVQTGGKYESRYLASTLEYRDDVSDGLEVSTRLG